MIDLTHFDIRTLAAMQFETLYFHNYDDDKTVLFISLFVHGKTAEYYLLLDGALKDRVCFGVYKEHETLRKE